MKHPHFLEGDPCPIPGCHGHFVHDTAADGDFLRCDTCHLLDDEAEESWSPIGKAAKRVCDSTQKRSQS
jgi:hypothetical protein